MRAMSYRYLACFSIAAATFCPSTDAVAGTIEGAVAFPSQNVPAMTVYASELETSRLHTVQLARGQTTFMVEVPPGQYFVFLAPNEPGAPDIYGAFTRYSLCAPHEMDGQCKDHSLVPVTVAAKTPHVTLTVDDWYLTDEVAGQIDRVLDAAAGSARFASKPLSAPRFSEYPSESFERAMLPRIDFTGSDLSEQDRDLVEQALGAGPNFAGHVTVAVTSCGLTCGRIVLVDWHSGAIQELASSELGEESLRTLPCRAEEALQFRLDSRLLSVTRVRGAAIVTQYYVWNQKGAPTRAGEYQRSSQAFCAVAAG
jgi:hypothetical protein